MRNGHLRETVDGKVYNSFTGREVRWDFGMGQWVAVPEPTEGIKVFIASNPDGTFQELGGITGITFSGNEDDDDFGGETISTLRTDTFRVTFKNAEETAAALGYPTPTAAWPVNMKAWDDALRRERERRRAMFDKSLEGLRIKGWPEPTYPQLTERQMSPSVYTPQPEDPLFTSEEIEKAAQHVGVRGIERAYGVVVEQGLAGVREAIAKARDEYETSTEGKKLSKKERIAELEQTVETLLTNTKSWEADYKELESEVDEANKSILSLERELDDLRNVEVKLDTQLEINHTLKTRITNQRTELRRLNQSLHTKSLEAKMLGIRVKMQAEEEEHRVGTVRSQQLTIDHQQKIIDRQSAELAKKSWWRS